MVAQDPPESEKPVEIPYRKLAPATLRALVEEFITREGTDYGLEEKTLEEKVADVMKQLERGEAKIVFELETETANIVPSR
jgi:uncharacterized protein YheU (UPF0270 family)